MEPFVFTNKSNNKALCYPDSYIPLSKKAKNNERIASKN